MEIATTRKFARFLLILGLIAFLSVAFFGAPQSMMGMEKRADGTMSGCLFMGMEEICTMTFTQHLNQWQNMFTTTAPQKALTFALLFLLAVVFVAIVVFKRNLLLLFNYHATRSRLYLRHNPELSLFNFFKKAFSQGILNPKIY